MMMLRAMVGVFTVGLVSVFGLGSLSAAGSSLLAGGAPSAGGSQAMGAKTESVSLEAQLLKDWSGLKETMHKIADEMPADKYNFKPTEAQQTFGERTVHVASSNVFIFGLLGGTGTPKPTIDEKATSKDAALKALDDSFDYGIAVLKQQTAQTLLQPVGTPPKFMGPSSRARAVWFLMGHTWNMYGQMVVYLRLNGHVPPASQKM